MLRRCGDGEILIVQVGLGVLELVVLVLAVGAALWPRLHAVLQLALEERTVGLHRLG